MKCDSNKSKSSSTLNNFQPMTGGYVNSLLKCHLKQDTDDEDSVIVRLFGHVEGYNRDIEVHIMKMLSDRGVIPPLYCR